LATIALDCPSCRATNPPDAKFCNQCAFMLQASGLAERRQLTVLFSDLVGSTALSRELDAEDFRDLINEYHALCHEIVTELGGHIAQCLGDGVMVYFGYPEAHEDDPRRAVQAGIGIRDRVRSLKGRLQLQPTSVSRVRIGIHTGVVVIGQVGAGREHLALGETPNLAARLQQLARPDGVVVSEATRRLIEGFFELEFGGHQTIKGYDEPVAVHEVLTGSAPLRRVDTPVAPLSSLVGRDRETAQIAAAWHAVTDGRTPRTVLISGEAGVGKSRQVRAFRQAVREEHWELEAVCSPLWQNTAFRPLAQALGTVACIHELPDLAAKYARLKEHVLEFALDQEAVALLAPVLALPVPEAETSNILAPHVKRQRTMQWLIAWLRAIAARRPVLFVLEDLQWADPSTLEFLGTYLRAEVAEPLFLLATSRPEFEPTWPVEQFARLDLRRVGPSLAERIILPLAQGRALPRAVVERIIDLSDGVPLYLEEVTKAFLESGALRVVGDRYELLGALPEAVLPATVHDSLMARLDRTGDAKSVAQLASALGREFSQEVLYAVSLMDEMDLNSALRRLTEAGLVVAERREGSRSYRFKHALIQEAAYQSLLKSKRQKFHHRIARVLEEQFPETLRTQPDLVAQHYAKANLSEEAATYFERAGMLAFSAQAYAEASHHFTNSLSQLQRLPAGKARDRRELEVLSASGLPLLMTKGYAAPDVEEVYNQALRLCAEVDPPIRVLYGVWVVQHVRGDRAATDRMALQFAEIAGSTSNDCERLIAWAAVGARHFWQGAFEDATVALEHAVRCFAPAMMTTLARDYGYDNPLYGHLMLAWAQSLSGRIGDAQATWEEAWAITELAKAPYLTVMALSFGAAIARDLGDSRRALELSERGVALANAHHLLFWLALAQMQHGSAHALGSHAEAGMAEIEQGMQLFGMIGAALTLPYYLSYLADACWRAGATERGLAAVERGLDLAAKNADRNATPELLRIKAELLAQQGGSAAGVEAFLREALFVARADGAGVWELRAAMSLARILARRGELDEAATILSASCARIRGGMPPILLEARALLAEMASASSPAPTRASPAG
jgi:class 3 adenylate cyclase/predicted ATPase